MMDILFCIAAALAVGHWIYEGIIAPTLRTQVDNELFELRDRLRSIKINEGEKCNEDAYDIVDTGINRYIGRTEIVTISFTVWLKRMQRNPEFLADLKERQRLLKECETAEIMECAERGQALVERALIVNTIPFALQLLPIAAIATMTSVMHRQGRRLFASGTSRTDELIRQNTRLHVHA